MTSKCPNCRQKHHACYRCSARLDKVKASMLKPPVDIPLGGHLGIPTFTSVPTFSHRHPPVALPSGRNASTMKENLISSTMGSVVLIAKGDLHTAVTDLAAGLAKIVGKDIDISKCNEQSEKGLTRGGRILHHQVAPGCTPLPSPNHQVLPTALFPSLPL